MASLTIRVLSDDVMLRLRIQAAEHGHSMEEEARAILCKALNEPETPGNLSRAIRARFAPMGGVELEIPPRDPVREPPGATFSAAPGTRGVHDH